MVSRDLWSKVLTRRVKCDETCVVLELVFFGVVFAIERSPGENLGKVFRLRFIGRGLCLRGGDEGELELKLGDRKCPAPGDDLADEFDRKYVVVRSSPGDDLAELALSVLTAERAS